MIGWHHLFDGHELEQTPGDREACSSWGRKGSDMIEQLNNNQFLSVELNGCVQAYGICESLYMCLHACVSEGISIFVFISLLM